MKRREFLKITGATLAAPLVSCSLWAKKTNDPMQRITMSTVMFRARFAQTRIRNHTPIPELKLLDVPEYWADRFKLHNVEFWSKHFESRDEAYIKELKKKIVGSKSRLVNVQVDETYNLAEKNEEKRKKHVEFFKGWVDTAAMLGSEAIRANTGSGELDACIKSFRELVNYAHERKILFLVENHGGLSSDPEKLVQLVKTIDSKNLEILPDFGNFPAPIRYEGLQKILPHAKHLISAKTHQFDAAGKHADFDFDRCVSMAKTAGFPGIYSAEYYDRHGKPVDYEKIADWMLEHLKDAL